MKFFGIERAEWIVGLVMVVVVSGCASLGQSVGLGVGMGAGAGALAGNAVRDGNGSHASTVIGAVTGAAVGGLMGFIAHKGKEEKDLERFRKGNVPELGNYFLGNAEVEHIWIPPKIEGNRAVDGYYIHVIKRPTEWRSK